MTCSKSSIVVALCLLPTGKKLIFGKNCWFLNEIASEKGAVKDVANGVHTAKLETKNHLWRQKRERLALMAADMWVWVYNSTVYNTKGTTWSGSPLWKQAQQVVWQHWFIDSYIAGYIQVHYRVTGVHPTGLTVARGVGRCSQAI